MLKKPSAIPLIRGAHAANGAMEVESTRVQTLPDGKKMIDVTMRRPQNTPRADDKLVRPLFEDDSSSSSDEEDDATGASLARHRPEYESPVKTKLKSRDFREDPEDKDEEDENNASVPGANAGFHGTFEWSGVQDIQTLTHANTALHEQVVDLKDQLKTLQIQLEAMAPVPGLNTAAVQDILLDKDGTQHDIRDTKIVHQAKTLRHLKRSLQREKQLAVDAVKQCKAMETVKIQLEKENETLKLKLARFQARATAAALPVAAAAPCSDDEPVASSETSKDAKERESVALYKKKFEDMRIKHDKLLSDLKKTQRALIREVGDDVPLEELVEGSSGVNGEQAKRGRAQQIVMLKSKVKKLEQELAKANANSASTGPASPSRTSSDVDQRAQQDILAQQSQRQRMIDKLTAERDDLQERMHQLTKKFDGLKSRTQTIEKEKQEHKTKVQVLVDKSRNDDALVDALQKQLETWKGKLQEAKRARTAESSSIGSGGSGGLPKDDRLELDRLRAMVADYKRQQQQASNNIAASGSLMPPPSEAAQYRAIAAEKERLSEQVKSLQTQVEDQERQLRAAKPTNGMETTAPPPSRIPRLVPGSLPASQYYPAPPAADSSNTEALRKSFGDAMAGKEQEIENLKQQIQRLSHAATASPSEASRGAQQEIQDLQEENLYLRQEFDRLKTRYETLLKNNRSANKGNH